MMNDRFDAQLREHLLGIADTKPGEGQLASVVQSVAHTAQRQPLVARLTWFPGRVGPFRTSNVRLGLVVAALIAVMAAALIIGSSPRRSTVFEGSWISIDPGDGSTQTLIVGAGLSPTLRFTDDRATGFACRDDASKVFTAQGLGTVVPGDRLESVWPSGGGCGLRTVEMAGGYFDFHAATNTLVDGTRLTWVRADAGQTPPAPVPTVQRVVEGCAGGIPAGARYVTDVGPLSVRVTIPTDASMRWSCERDTELYLAGYSDDSPDGASFRASIVSYVDGTCDPGGAGGVDTAAEAVAAIRKAEGIEVSEPTTLTLAGHAATRLQVAAGERLCVSGLRLWNGLELRGGEFLYLIDVDGGPLGIAIRSDVPSEIAEADAIVASLEIDKAEGAEPTRAPAPTADPGCIQLDGTGTYTAPVGQLSVSATVPNDASRTWAGSRTWFGLQQSPCGYDPSYSIVTQLVSRVAVDACRGFEEALDVRSAAEAADALEGQASTDVDGRVDVTVDGRPGVRLAISPSDGVDIDLCAESSLILLGQGSDDTFYRLYYPVLLYLVDVDGEVLQIVIDRADGGLDQPAFRAEIDGMMDSLDIR